MVTLAVTWGSEDETRQELNSAETSAEIENELQRTLKRITEEKLQEFDDARREYKRNLDNSVKMRNGL